VLESYLSSATLWLLVFLTAVALVDLRTRRIPNGLVLTAALTGLLLNLWQAGAHGAVISALGASAGLGAFLPFYVAGGFGAGDVKAMGAIGAFVGVKGVLLAAGWTLLVGGIGALGVLAAVWWRARAEGSWQLSRATRHRFPYGLAIAGGTALSLWLGRIA
jgi:prepilin peptidase CpaA